MALSEIGAFAEAVEAVEALDDLKDKDIDRYEFLLPTEGTRFHIDSQGKPMTILCCILNYVGEGLLPKYQCFWRDQELQPVPDTSWPSTEETQGFFRVFRLSCSSLFERSI